MSPTTNSESDSEDDLDYVPPADDHDSDSSDERNKVGPDAETVSLTIDPAQQKKERDALWATFQASVSAPSSSSNRPSGVASQAKRVKIQKTYLFAGKHITDVVEVAEDSEDAKKWPRWSPHTHTGPTSEPAPTATPSSSSREGQGQDDEPAPPPAVDLSHAAPTPVASTPGAKRPGPRKPRTVLPSIPNASQVKKITTLDKSAMDWRTHLASQSSDVKDELDANKRGGGYLEKVEFLQRVEDRREDAFEASKSNKRRRT